MTTTAAITVKENQVGELQEEINTLVTKTNELIASSSVDPSVAALLQSMTVIIKLLSKQNLNVNNSNAAANTSASSNGPAPLAAAPPPPPPIQQLPPLNAHTDDEHKDRLIMPIEINSEIQAKCKEMLEKRRKSVRLEDSSSSEESSPSSDDESEVKKRPTSKKNSVSDKSKTTRTSSSRKPQPRKRSSISSRGSNDKQNGCTVS